MHNKRNFLSFATQLKVMKVLGIGLFFVFALHSCQLFDKEEQIPAYIHIEKIDVVSANVGEGALDHAIKDVWFFHNDNLLGMYELPATIPVLAEGNQSFMMAAGIENNGIADTRLLYPFYTFDAMNIQVSPTEVDTAEVEVTYRENLEFWHENFELPGTKFVRHSSSDTTLSIDNTTPYEFGGTGIGRVVLTNEKNFFRVDTDEDIALPGGGVQSYLEISYNTNNEFKVFLTEEAFIGTRRIEVYRFYPTDQTKNNGWNKLYIDLTFLTTYNTTTDRYELSFEMQKNAHVSQAQLWIDNIKLISFK